MGKILRNYWLLIFIVLIAIILRFYQLSSIPISLNHDETAIGYNAYSILKTGADEFGKVFPLTYKSFGDWKLILYPLLTIPSILLFDLTPFAVRLPSALAGIISVVLIYVLAMQLFKNKSIALIASLFLALSPWGIYFSRVAYEANVATMILLGAVICYAKFYGEKKSSKWLIVSSILLGLTLFTYHAFVIFAPLFFLGLVVLALKNKHRKDLPTYIAFGVFILFCLVSAIATYSSGSLDKLSSTSLFEDKQMLQERVNDYRGDKSEEITLLSKAFHNTYTAVGYQSIQNYLLTYSPTFLFDKGGEKLLHNIGNFGNFYAIDSLFLIVGILALFFNRIKRLDIILLWLLVGPIPSAFTVEAPSSTRLFLMLPVLILVSSYGFYVIGKYLLLRSLFLKGVFGIILVLFMINFVYFLDAYFVHMNYHRAQFLRYGFKEVVELANRYPDYNIVMNDPTNFPYISFLFYNKYDRVRFRQEVEYYTENYGLFIYVKSFGRYTFLQGLQYENLNPRTIYIDDRVLEASDKTINDPSGKPMFIYTIKE